VIDLQTPISVYDIINLHATGIPPPQYAKHKDTVIRWGGIVNKIKYYREYYGISQRQLARHAKVSYAEMSYIEADLRIPNVYMAMRIAKILKVPVEAIFIE